MLSLFDLRRVGNRVRNKQRQLTEPVGDLGIHVTRVGQSREQCTQSAREAHKVSGTVRRYFKELYKEDFMVIYKAYNRP